VQRHIITLILTSIITNINAMIFDQKPSIQNKISVGLYSSPEVESGLNIGYGYYRYIDEMVSLGIGMDMFWTNYLKESTVNLDSTGVGQTISTKEVEIDMTSYLLPLLGTAKITFPFELGTTKPYTNINLGWNILFNKETNYVTGDQKYRFFNGLGWGVALGSSLTLGEKSSIGIETFYRSAKLKANVDETELGLPIYDEIDMSGIGLQLGLFMNF